MRLWDKSLLAAWMVALAAVSVWTGRWPVWAATTPAKHQQRAVLRLKVNQIDKGDILAVVAPNDVLVRVEDLEKAGVRNFAGSSQKIGPDLYVSLGSLAPGISYKLDVQAVALDLTASAAYLGQTRVNLQTFTEPSDIIHTSNPAFFLNYALTLSQFNSVTSFEDIGWSLFGNTLLDSTVFTDPTGKLTRGMTNLTIDDRFDMRRLLIGDTFAVPSDPLGGAVPFGGVSLSRNFQLNPYFAYFPSGTFSGVATLPSTVDVYVNGVRVKEINVPPGVFQLQNIPLTNGAGNTQVVVRNALGQVQQTTSSYYFNSQTLSPGVNSYSLNVGSLRENFGLSSWRYGEPIFDLNFQRGLTELFTSGIRVEGSPDVISGGPSLTTSTPVGAFGISAAMSDATLQLPALLGGPPPPTRRTTGYAASLSYSYLTRGISLGGGVQLMSNHYSNLSLTPADDRPKLLGSFSVTFPIGSRTTLVPEFQYLNRRDEGAMETYSATADVRLTQSLFLFLNVTHLEQSQPPASTSIVAGLSMYLGNQTEGTVNFGQNYGGEPSNRGNLEGVQLLRSLPIGPGYGYLLNAQTGQGAGLQSADLQYRGLNGYYEFDYLHQQSGQESETLDLSGSLVAVGGRLFPSSPITGAFALVRTDDAPNVETYFYSQPVGRTDSRGDLIVPTLLPYFGNELSVNDRDLPIDFKIDSTKLTVAPPNRGGAIVDFPIRRIRGFIGKLEVIAAGKRLIPSFGTFTLTAHGKAFTSPISKAGDFYLDSPPSGRFPATVDFAQGLCKFNVEIPGGKEPFVKLGTLRCTM